MQPIAFLTCPTIPLRSIFRPGSCSPRVHKWLCTLSHRSDESYMKEAIEQAELARHKGEVPVGAVLVDSSGSVISKGHNLVESFNDCTRHAEMVCLQNAMAHLSAWRLTGTTLYSTLEPCPMCLSAITLARVQRLVYGAPDLRLGACGTFVDLLNHRHPFHNFDDVTGGVLADDCVTLMKDFFRKRRKDPPRYAKPNGLSGNGITPKSHQEHVGEEKTSSEGTKER